MKRILLLCLLWMPYLLAAQDFKIGDCFVQKSSGLKYCFGADSSTHDLVLGDSYRIFLISNPEDGTELDRHKLEVNLAADFGYEFVREYLEIFNLLIIRGAQAFYLYQTENGTLSDYIKPDHEDCAFSDNQGTYINNLKIVSEGSILQLDVKECGTRYFDIKDIENIVEIKPEQKADCSTKQ